MRLLKGKGIAQHLNLEKALASVERALQGGLDAEVLEQAIAGCRAAAAELRAEGFNEEADGLTQ